MKKLFISLPMNGRSILEIKETQKAIASDFSEYELLPTLFDLPEGTPPLKYLAKSIEALSKADLAIFAPGWDKARGCCIEQQCAAQYGIKIIYY